MMIKKMIYLALLACAVALNSCDEPGPYDDHPIVGTWVVDVGGPDYAYGATWQIHGDATYHIEFASSGFSGKVTKGSSNGTYNFISDSIMVVHTPEYENLAGNDAFAREYDTLFVQLTDESLLAVGARLVGPSEYEWYGSGFFWQKK